MGLITNFCCVNSSGVLCILCTKYYQIKLLFLRAKPEQSHKVQAGLSYWARSSCWIQFLRFSCWANSPIRVFVLGKGFLLDSFKAFSRTSLHRLSQSTQTTTLHDSHHDARAQQGRVSPGGETAHVLFSPQHPCNNVGLLSAHMQELFLQTGIVRHDSWVLSRGSAINPFPLRIQVGKTLGYLRMLAA